MVRLSDKVTRLATFNRTGSLTHEGVEDTLIDLASYSLLALVLYREERDGRVD
jgi:sigma54-dependent transcription regulator